MTSTTATLPAGFEDLAPLVPIWGHATENERSDVRWSAKAEDFAAFYQAFMPRLEDALGYLAQFEIKDLSPEARRLFHLACAFAEASPHHELYNGSPAVPFSFDARRFVPAHGDRPAGE